MFYEEIANELVKRILKLIPKHKEILKMEDAFDMFDIKGFKCDDLEPTFFQASWALVKAQKEYRKLKRVEKKGARV